MRIFRFRNEKGQAMNKNTGNYGKLWMMMYYADPYLFFSRLYYILHFSPIDFNRFRCTVHLLNNLIMQR
jgi:hypothetical protein